VNASPFLASLPLGLSFFLLFRPPGWTTLQSIHYLSFLCLTPGLLPSPAFSSPPHSSPVKKFFSTGFQVLFFSTTCTFPPSCRFLLELFVKTTLPAWSSRALKQGRFSISPDKRGRRFSINEMPPASSPRFLLLSGQPPPHHRCAPRSFALFARLPKPSCSPLLSQILRILSVCPPFGCTNNQRAPCSPTPPGAC